MYFWKIEELREKLISERLGERARFIYLILFVLMYELCSLIPDGTANAWGWAVTIVSIALTVLGTYWLYRINGGEGGLELP